MTTSPALREVVLAAVARYDLLSHPFYRRWSAGELHIDELRSYASQYRHIEAALPRWLEGVRDGAVEPHLRAAASRNLGDEAGGAVTHLDLFDTFAAVIEAEPATPSPATQHLLDEHTALVASSASEGMSAILAYEVQAPAVAASKSAGLRTWYGLDERATAFWDVHTTVDHDHVDWALDGLAGDGVDPAVVDRAARRAASAWWSFLDEREAARPAVPVGSHTD